MSVASESLRARLGLLAVALATGSCTVTHMQVPAAALATPPWSVSGYAEQSIREPAITIAGRTVERLVRVRRPLKSTSSNGEPSDSRGYRFALRFGNDTLTAECRETVAPKQLWLLRFGQGAVRLECSCRAGEQTRASIALVEGQGTARLLGGPELSVTAVHRAADGKQKRALLGYTLSDGQGTAAVERTGAGRVWPLPAMTTAAATDLACVFAALLLYRPEP